MNDPTTIAQLLREPGADAPRTGRQLRRPATMVVLAFVFGAGLLGLAGWFIASSAVAGLAVASTFSFLFPSAEVQALAWARTLARYGERLTTHQATLDLVGSVRTSLFAHAVALPRHRAAQLRSSELLGRITVDSDAVENLLLQSSFPSLAAIAAVIGSAVMFVLLSPALAAVSAAGILLTAAIPMTLGRRQAGRPARGVVSARAQARRGLIETLDGLPELRSFGIEQRAAAGVSAALGRLADSRRRLTRLEAGGRGVGVLLADLTLLAIVATAAGLLGTRTLPAPAFVAVALVAIAAFEPIVALPATVTGRARARAATARLANVFSPVTETRVRGDVLSVWPVRIAIDLAGQRTELALAGGDTVVVTGASGAGKSTLLRAITGARVPGIQVLLADADAAELDSEALVEHITYVAQDAHVFDGTIRENLTLANPAVNEPELWRALAAAAFDDTVAAFPAGLDTPVGPGGAALSGGQRRRLSVAQGLLRRAAVLLLDEPTEGLDTPTAARLLAGVRRFDPYATLIIALHDRQSLQLPWTPSARLELTAPERPA